MAKTPKLKPIIHDPLQGEFWVTDDARVANTISLWDIAPRSIPAKAPDELKDGNYLKTLERSFTLAGNLYHVTVRPARFKDKSGKEFERYPGERERLVEWVIRRIAAMRNRISLSAKDEVNVSFTTHEVRTELARTGHAYSFYEITEALQVLHLSTVEIVKIDTGPDGHAKERVISASTFPQLSFSDRSKENCRSTVQLNWLATQAMKHLDFRQMNYEAVMGMRGPIERWVYTRLNHDVLYYRMHPHVHEIYASEVIDGAAMSNKVARNAMKRVTECMEALRADDVIRELQCEDVLDGRRKTDIKYTITLTDKFVEETTRSLRIANENLEDFREVAGGDPETFVPSDPIKKEKLRRIRSKRLAEQPKSLLLL